MFDYVACPPQDEMDYTFVTADTAYKDKQENDFSVFSAWGVKDEELYLMECYRKQIKAVLIKDDVLPFLLEFNSHYAFRGVWIEPKGHGIYLNQALPGDDIVIPGDEMIEDFFADRKLNKVERANNAAPRLRNRRVHINEKLANRETLRNEAVSFPKGAHDDFTDTLVDAIKMVYCWQPSILDVL
jgi:predicted phage terminase large subunit-like protein